MMGDMKFNLTSNRRFEMTKFNKQQLDEIQSNVNNKLSWSSVYDSILHETNSNILYDRVTLRFNAGFKCQTTLNNLERSEKARDTALAQIKADKENGVITESRVLDAWARASASAEMNELEHEEATQFWNASIKDNGWTKDSFQKWLEDRDNLNNIGSKETTASRKARQQQALKA